MNIGESKKTIVDASIQLSVYDCILRSLDQLIDVFAEHVAKQQVVLSNTALNRLAVLRDNIARGADDTELNGPHGLIPSWKKANPQQINDWLNRDYQYPLFYWSFPPEDLIKAFRETIKTVEQMIFQSDAQKILPNNTMLPVLSVSARATIREQIGYVPPGYVALKKQ